MLEVRNALERGKGNPNIIWLDSYHSFSFADYYDPKHVHFSHLRVINEDYVKPMNGFATHPHKDMEILTYVLSGSVEHQDSIGNKAQITTGEFQIMSAGTGITHSEVNPSQTETLHLYQIWIIPNQKGIEPRYGQGKFAPKEGATLILSPDANQGSFKINQDMQLWRWQLSDIKNKRISLQSERHYWLQMITGEITVNGLTLKAGDALKISQEKEVDIDVITGSEFLLFDLV